MTKISELGKTPKNILVNMQVERLGNIAFIMQFISLAIMFLGMATFMLVLVYYTVLFVIALFTFFLLFFSPEFVALFSAGDGVLNFSLIISNLWKITAPATIVFSVTSIVCLCLDKGRKHTAKIIISAVVAAIALAYLGSFIVALVGAR